MIPPGFGVVSQRSSILTSKVSGNANHSSHTNHGIIPTRALTCRNCGEAGHLYKDCKAPIMSFGIICFRVHRGQIEYLMVQRKESLAFMEFIRGKYNLMDETYLRKLMSLMTPDERRMLLVTKFEDMWNTVWFQPFIPRHTLEFQDSKEKFDQLYNGYALSDDQHISLQHLLHCTTSLYPEPEWGFPKGRRRLKEHDIQCAVREFQEETTYTKDDVSLVDNTPMEEIFFGTNQVRYRHVYYLAQCVKNSEKEIKVDPNNIHQAREIRAVKWFSFEDAIHRIRTHNKERKEIFITAHNAVIHLAQKGALKKTIS